MTDPDRTRVAAYALCRDVDGRILLCRLAPWVEASQPWTLPGGGLEFGEAPEAAVVRELAEEAGYDGEVEALHDVSQQLLTNHPPGRLHSIRIVYRVRITGGELRDEVDGSTDRCAWFSADEAARMHLVGLARRALADVVADPSVPPDPHAARGR